MRIASYSGNSKHLQAWRAKPLRYQCRQPCQPSKPLLFSNNVFKPCTCTAAGIPPSITNRLSHVRHPGTEQPLHPSWCSDGAPSINLLFAVVVPCRPFGHHSSHHQALATSGRLIRVLSLFDLCDEKIKAPANVLVIASAGFGPGAIVLLRQLLSIICADLALLGAEVTFVAHNDDRDPLDALLSSSNN